jgi:hypothetical protein
VAEQHTWNRADGLLDGWAEANKAAGGDGTWLPLGFQTLACGCVVDTFTAQENQMWRPCVAHEGEGHLSALSGPEDGVYIARCLVLACPWRDQRFWENDAITAAQQHWMETRAQMAGQAAGSS